jgi:hypothetical protein
MEVKNGSSDRQNYRNEQHHPPGNYSKSSKVYPCVGQDPPRANQTLSANVGKQQATLKQPISPKTYKKIKSTL